jgi:hypothetical protein
MPIVLGSGPVAVNLLELTNNVLEECGERRITTTNGQTGIPHLAAEYLNLVQRDIFEQVDMIPAQDTYVFGFGEGITSIPLPDDFDDSKSPPIDDLTPRTLTYMDPSSWHSQFSKKTETGNPRYWTLWENQIKVYPAASEDYIENKVIYHNGEYFVCIKAHTSPADVTGLSPANYPDYWEVLLWDDGGDQVADDWADATDYEDGTVRMLYYRRPVDMVNDSDVPDLPDRFTETLKLGATYKLKKRLMFPDAEQDKRDYEQRLNLHQSNSEQVPMPRGFRLGRGLSYGR